MALVTFYYIFYVVIFKCLLLQNIVDEISKLNMYWYSKDCGVALFCGTELNLFRSGFRSFL